ncbi:hypothetical protein ACOMHN_013435 [Nucella lapillus]
MTLSYGLRDKINLLLFWLAVADLSSLVSQVLLLPGCYLTDRTQVHNWAVVGNYKVSRVSWWLGNLSGILIVVLSVDRCLSVALPLKARRLLGYRLTVAGITLSYVVSLMIFLPVFLAYTVRWTTPPSTDRTIAHVDQTPWFPVDKTMAERIVFYCFLVALPFFLGIMVVCCTITIVHLRKASRQRLKLTENVTEEAKAGQNRITVMLLVICGVYIILAIPQITFVIGLTLVPEFTNYDKYNNTIIATYQFIWIGVCLNSTINFFVYLVLSSRFQRTLKNCFVSLCTNPARPIK